MHAVNPVGIPGLRLLQRAQEHFVQPQGVGSVFLDDLIGIDHVIHRLGHFFDGPATNVFAVFQNKLGIFVVGTPVAKTLQIKHVVVYNVYIHVNGSVFVLVFEIVGNKSVAVFDSVHKIGAALNHTLVNELLERFIFTYHPQIVQKFIPETAVQQVSGGVFRTPDV
ncbi:MAG: hypothetical protein BWX77_01217 [Bacteroidetes bacterium ADurb.Bin090]|nr:MAG: hypothetical protein BWX77_01217 [Bacteroidetes bacterium ADurb.Bin090]